MCEGDDDGGELDEFLFLKFNRSFTTNLDGTLNFLLQICAAVCASC